MGGRHSKRAKHSSEPEQSCARELRARLAEARQELKTLYAALDNVQSGLLLLDGELRARFSNPVLHTMFKTFSAEQIRREGLHYRDLLLAAANADAVDAHDYVERRLVWVKSGDLTPMDLAMTNGTVLRCQLAILPGGGRMLTYSNVTDIVRNAQEMERLANIDGMTGIYNRRHFVYLADREWARARRYERRLSFLMIDIDHFKKINDCFGHGAGDNAIVHVANLARACMRSSDVLARIGGEEFGLLLPETELSGAGGAITAASCRKPPTGHRSDNDR
jgi:GGDEF domain-containing protein